MKAKHKKNPVGVLMTTKGRVALLLFLFAVGVTEDRCGIRWGKNVSLGALTTLLVIVADKPKRK
jgi:hypothetical protein